MDNLGYYILEIALKILLALSLVLSAAAILVYLERKISAFIQNRIGPNRVGPFGVLQPFADVLKLLFKEDIVPKAANKAFHTIAPIIALGVAVAVYAVIPFADYITIGEKVIYVGLAPNVNIGILFILAMTSVGVYGLTLAGWSSNSKYSLLGGLRSSAQMISYELSMGLSIVGVLMVTGSLTLTGIVRFQEGWHWNIIYQPLGFIIFLVTAFAETNRAPFDLPEAEPELVGGFNTEYSGMKFGMFFLAEYANLATSSAIISLLYLGGWQMPFLYDWLALPDGSIALAIVQFLVFTAKIGLMVFFFIWVRWSIPRFRYDQLMKLGWRVLLPLALLNIAGTAIVMLLIR
jgi:NADH-quinone oxidoreductase subunit H